MTSCVQVVITVVVAACAGSTPTARERALAQLPSDAQLVAAADGPALATSTFRRVVDVARPHVPAAMGCVIDAAQTGEAAAVAVSAEGTMIVIITRAHVACPPLSKIANDTYVATIGAGATVRESSVLDSPRWARARRYLAHDPVAIAYEGASHRIIAVAQPEPIAAWSSLDGSEVDGIAKQLRPLFDRWKKLVVTRSHAQLLVRAERLDADELVALVGELLTLADAPAVRTPAIACAPIAHGIASCKDGTRYTVTSVADIIRSLATGDTQPVIDNGDVIGIELTSQPPVLLERGDILLGIDSHRITNVAQLRDLARHLGDHAALGVRRAGSDFVVDLHQ